MAGFFAIWGGVVTVIIFYRQRTSFSVILLAGEEEVQVALLAQEP
jgi:hypothetical protein